MDIAAILEGPNGASVLGALVGSSFLLLGWLANKLFDSKMKQLDGILKELKEIDYKINKISLDMAVLMGKVEQVNSFDRKIENVEKTVWALESQVKAAWRTIDKIKVV